MVRDFLDPKEFYGAVRKHGIDYFCGVPDSLLKDFCAYVSMNVPDENHIITANEGAAIAVASGYHLASGKTAMVYLQVCFESCISMEKHISVFRTPVCSFWGKYQSSSFFEMVLSTINYLHRQQEIVHVTVASRGLGKDRIMCFQQAENFNIGQAYYPVAVWLSNLITQAMQSRKQCNHASNIVSLCSSKTI